MARILVVEDDGPIAELIEVHLRRAGHDVLLAHDGEQALVVQRSQRPDLILLDLMLPRLGGIEVCEAIRQVDSPQPVIVMLTARRDEVDALAGFEAGADDYIRKPFFFAELVRRVDALLALAGRLVMQRAEELRSRVTATATRGGPAAGPNLQLDAEARIVRVLGRRVHLTPKEFELLYHLIRHPNAVVAREALLAQVWSYKHAGYARTVDTHVMRIRKKLGEAGLKADPITTVHGVGYRFESQVG